MSISKQAEDLLDYIEAIEFRSLSWGFADGSLSMHEVMGLAQKTASDAPGELIEELVAARLIFEWDNAAGETRYRSRFAETMRLLSRLRQLFPDRPWFGAPRLVSDFRVDIRRRRYPRRDRDGAAIFSEHEAVLGESPLRRRLWHALVGEAQLKLAAFQERATLRLLSRDPDAATIVTAGTGSGKTLSFYLPALMRIGELIQANQYWVKAIAIYPRIELLKDQLSEAFFRARRLDATLIGDGRRPITVGALFGSTPKRADKQSLQNAKWKWVPRSNSFVCPWFKCPHCNGDLTWQADDIARQVERLICANVQCRQSIDSNHLVLTRNRLVSHPPDILFTTTEMLNQRMSDLEMRKVFGIGVFNTQKPVFALLDEVHTYVGTSGAQAALVLRRWRHLIGVPVTWCGLSATLQESARFFADLTGVAKDNVVEVAPAYDELVEEGADYQAILRGDPMLQASVLSTTIQAAMLAARMMDPQGNGLSFNRFGQRVFVFTDDLDVTNRLFDNLRDAEAYNIFGDPDNGRFPLAAQRARTGDDDSRREADGQRWWAAERIGRNLADRLRVGRTTSQDSGVLANADVIVATASLEVGYNDEQVGAVIQHKAPRNMASFLQRKGRAGRMRGMRPLTVTVLSEYGRDRVAFQAYEYLFDPVVEAQHLPVLNQYVLRIQAVFSFFDWLACEASQSYLKGWIWDILSQPESFSRQLEPMVLQRLTSLLRGEQGVVASLTQHLRRSLGLQLDVVDSILWDPPRALLLEVVPTLTRRLIRNWQLAVPTGDVKFDFWKSFHPLPDFVPQNLFSDLSLPEVQIVLPPATVNDKEKYDSLPIVQTLQQLAPGRVTRRFAHERGGLCHWFPLNLEDDLQVIPIDNYARLNEALGIFTGTGDDGSSLSMQVYRPWEIRLARTLSNEVLPTSNAFPRWYSHFMPQGTPVVIPVPPRSAWFDLVSDVRFHLHRFRGSVTVRRFSPVVRANLRRKSGDKIVRVEYADPEGKPAAVGFEVEVDGFFMDFKLPSPEALVKETLPGDLSASSRLAYHRYCVLSDKTLPAEIDTLQREWLHQILVSAALAKAQADGMSVGQAARSILENDPTKTFAKVLCALFALQDVEAESLAADEDSEPEEEEGSTQNVSRKVSRLEERLLGSIGRPDVIQSLLALVPELDSPTPSHFGAWLFRTLHETLAESVLQACINSAPRHAATEGIVADLEVVESGLARVWITETTLGGAGVIQAFAGAFAEEPRGLFRAIEAALAPTDLELASLGLKQFLILTCDNESIADLTHRLRSMQSHQAREAIQTELYQALSHKGIDVGHALSVSLNARILRPGMGTEWDRLLRDLLLSWEELEAQHQLGIGLREFCYVALDLPGVRASLRQMLQGTYKTPGDAEFIQVLGGLLWPRGIEIRQRALQSYNPFRTRRLTDPALVRCLLLANSIPTVVVGTDDWQSSFTALMAEYATVQLQCAVRDEHSLRQAIVEVLSTPIDVGYLQFFPVVERIERSDADTRATLSLREHV